MSSERGFLGARMVAPDAVDAPFAFLGVPFGPPYGADDLTEGIAAPARVRAAYDAYPWTHARGFNFEWGKPLSDDGVMPLDDAGDVPGDVRDIAGSAARVTATVRTLLDRGAIPLVQGGLDSVPPLVLAAYDGRVNVLHVDSHLDFRDEVDGMRDGYASPIRRIRELEAVGEIVQIGLRGSGSATRETVEEARAAGNRLVPARAFKEQGVAAFASTLALDAPWVVTLDCDGLDPTIAPGVAAPEPGGLDYLEMLGVLEHLTRRRALAGFICTEYVPALDRGGITANTVSRLFAAAVALHGVN